MYIERAKAIHAVEKKLNDARENGLFQATNYLSIAKALLRAIPAAAVAPVVRCKDCKHFREWPGDRGTTCAFWTDVWDMPTDPDAFCSYGERRDTDVH